MLYAWSENFVLPLSHDEVVHGKRSMLSKMPGDRWQQFANLRALYGYMWARPGKKLLFMGSEFGQWSEWNHDESLDWDLLQGSEHRESPGARARSQSLLSRASRRCGRPTRSRGLSMDRRRQRRRQHDRLHADCAEQAASGWFASAISRRWSAADYRVGVPRSGYYREILNTDAELWGGSNVGNGGGVSAEPTPYNGLPYSISITLPPLGVLWFEVPRD